MKRRSFLAMLGLAPVAAAQAVKAAASGPVFASGGYTGLTPARFFDEGAVVSGRITATAIHAEKIEVGSIPSCRIVDGRAYGISLQRPRVYRAMKRNAHGRLQCQVIEVAGDYDHDTHAALAGFLLRQF